MNIKEKTETERKRRKNDNINVEINKKQWQTYNKKHIGNWNLCLCRD